MAESNEAAELEAQLTALMKRHELDLIKEIGSGLAELRGRLPAPFSPGMLVAEEFIQKMRERQP